MDRPSRSLVRRPGVTAKPKKPRKPRNKDFVRDHRADMLFAAGRWLKGAGCGDIVESSWGASGLRGEHEVVVTCCLTRADFTGRDKLQAGDWRFFLAPLGIISPRDLPPGWGLLHYTGGKAQPVLGVPEGEGWATLHPFVATPPKRPRGRPRKGEEPPPKDPTIPKRGRGRPRKMTWADLRADRERVAKERGWT